MMDTCVLQRVTRVHVQVSDESVTVQIASRFNHGVIARALVRL